MTRSEVADPAAAAREALKRRDWNAAYEGLRAAASAGSLSPDDLVRLGEAAFWTGRPNEFLQANERAYAGYIERDDRCNAGFVALGLAREYQHKLAHAVAAGWFSRAKTLLEQDPSSREYGYLVLARVSGAQAEGDFDRALELARDAIAIGLRFEDRDLQALGRHREGLVLLAKGDVHGGRAMLDEATVTAVAGELGTLTTAVVYCNTIGACRDLGDYRRAGEWTEAAARWCEDQAVAGFPGVCRVHRAEVMRIRGDWAKAEGEARRACEELEDFARQVAGEGYNEIGEIRLRQGDFAGAEDAFQRAYDFGQDPQPGLALLWLAEGQAEAAATAIGRALEDAAPSRLARARLLPAQVEIGLAVGDRESARAAAAELEEIARLYGSPAMEAAARYAEGAIHLEAGEAAEAIPLLKRAHQAWSELEMPYEAARARILLGSAYQARGDDATARLELRAARSVLARLGALPEVRRVGELLGEQPREDHARDTRTFMFTDIVDSTKLVVAMGDEAWAELLRWHDEILRGLFSAHRGSEINRTGDGFFVGFEDAGSAIDCAVAIQRTLADHRRAHGFAPQVRIGLHGAQALRRGRDYGGRGVHEAARISALAKGGEIVASSDSLPEGAARYTVSEAREVALKGLSEPVRVVTIEWK